MTVFAIRWPSRAARRPTEQPADSAGEPLPERTAMPGDLLPLIPNPAGTMLLDIAADLPPVVQPGPNGCTKRVTCRGRAGKDGRCAAHKEP